MSAQQAMCAVLWLPVVVSLAGGVPYCTDAGTGTFKLRNGSRTKALLETTHINNHSIYNSIIDRADASEYAYAYDERNVVGRDGAVAPRCAAPEFDRERARRCLRAPGHGSRRGSARDEHVDVRASGVRRRRAARHPSASARGSRNEPRRRSGPMRARARSSRDAETPLPATSLWLATLRAAEGDDIAPAAALVAALEPGSDARKALDESRSAEGGVSGTPLWLACLAARNGAPGAIELACAMVEKGADPSIPGTQGVAGDETTPLWCCLLYTSPSPRD